MGNILLIALAQYPFGRDPSVIVEEAKDAGAEIVVFPEMYSNGCAGLEANDPLAMERWQNGAHSPDGNYMKQFREAAKAHRIHVVATFLEAADAKPFNSALLIDPGGHTVLHHRKVYICDFDPESPDAACGRGTGFIAGEIETSAGIVKLGLMICMDREYPEAARSLSSQGAEIALVPNCCTLATDDVSSDVRIAQARGRAFEMVMGIAVANYPAPDCDGHSFATDPTGTVIAMAGDSPGLVLAPFDLSLIRKSREEDHFRWRLD
jgi:predicted amidohydrolase